LVLGREKKEPNQIKKKGKSLDQKGKYTTPIYLTATLPVKNLSSLWGGKEKVYTRVRT